jgi:succinate-semialdehyde dehydrogenase/glutarate-semialdehyde dehydrogenase
MKLNDPTLFHDQCYIDGKWVPADTGATFDIDNPADGSLLGTVPAMGVEETRRAIEAAAVALSSWRALSAHKRSFILRRWFELIMENQDDLAVIMTSEQGKPLPEARGEISYGASFLEWFSEEAKRVYGDTLAHQHPDKRLIVIKQPVGVCAAITPWNFPSAMITRKAGAALAAGCTMVLKPASQTPYSALALCELARRAGLPAGVLNVVTGDAEPIGGELMASSLVRKLTFTGSTEVGKMLMRGCADTVKKISLELGGNAPFIVFDDADIDAAVKGAVSCKFRNTGQTCVCANRILVQDAVYETFVEKLNAAVSKLVTGSGFEENIDLGPLVDMAAVKKVETHIADAVSKGARVLAGGGRHPLGGTFFEPTILSGATSEMRVAKEETFGPLAPLFRFSTEAEALAMANDTEFGLAAYFYSRNVNRVWRVSEALEYGMVGINTGLISSEVVPFGGIKASGIGREGSKYGIEEFIEIKSMCIGGIEA